VYVGDEGSDEQVLYDKYGTYTYEIYKTYMYVGDGGSDEQVLYDKYGTYTCEIYGTYTGCM